MVKVRDAVMTLLSPGLLAGSAVLAPFNRKKHYMHIYWKDEETGDKKWAVFKVPGSRRRALLGELASVTEKEWKHLPRERKELRKRRKKLRKERKKEERNAIPIRLKGQLSVIDGVEIVEP